MQERKKEVPNVISRINNGDMSTKYIKPSLSGENALCFFCAQLKLSELRVR